MPKFTLNPSLKKKSIVMSFLLICVFFILEDTFSIKHWNRNYITILYNHKADVILLKFTFFDIDHSANKENGYLEWCKFEYTTDGENYKTFMRCETNNKSPIVDPIYPTYYWVTLTHKLNGARIKLEGTVFHKIGTVWADSTNVFIAGYISFGTDAYTILEWYLENLNVKKIRLSGKWSVSGLYCPDYFCEVYDLSISMSKQVLKVNNLIGSENNNETKVFKQADAIVVKGTAIGEKINIYTNSGAKIKSIVANNDLVTIKLPAKQVYLMNIGQTRYKIAL